jgi:hypothetical protein
MKKVTLALFFITVFAKAEAQVLINLQLPASGITIKPQLWNLSLVNAGTANVNVKIDMTFTDVANNQLVFTASTRTFTLTQQLTLLQANDLTPIIYNVVSGNYSIDADPNGFLPIGVYEVCYAVMKQNNEVFDKIAEDCETVEIEPVSPPVLIDPADEDSIYQVRPFFTWIPPVPAMSFNNLSYDWVLVEVMAMQNSADAIQQNVPLHTEQNLMNNSLLYPYSVPPLDTGKIYAWQVAAKSSNNAISKSEIWTFKIRKEIDSLEISALSGNYIPLVNKNEAGYTTLTDDLRIEYLNEINDTSVLINFYDITGTSRAVIGTDTAFKRIHFGQNFILIPVKDLPAFIHKHIYLFELINSKPERWYLKFEFRKPENN